MPLYTAIDITGKKYKISLPVGAKVQQLLDESQKAMKSAGSPMKLSGVMHEGRKLDPEMKLSNYGFLNTNKMFYLLPLQIRSWGSRVNTSPINTLAAKEVLEERFADPRFHEQRLGQKTLTNYGNQYNLPLNIERKIGKFAGFKGGKTRKTKKAKKQTRKRR